MTFEELHLSSTRMSKAVCQPHGLETDVHLSGQKSWSRYARNETTSLDIEKGLNVGELASPPKGH